MSKYDASFHDAINIDTDSKPKHIAQVHPLSTNDVIQNDMIKTIARFFIRTVQWYTAVIADTIYSLSNISIAMKLKRVLSYGDVFTMFKFIIIESLRRQMRNLIISLDSDFYSRDPDHK